MVMDLRKRLQLILSVVLLFYVGGVILIAVSSQLPGMARLSSFDKLIHAVEFFFLSVLVLVTLAVYGFDDYLLIGFVAVLILIVITEIIQIPIVNRSFSVDDIIADLLGASIGFAVVYGVDKRWNLLKRFY